MKMHEKELAKIDGMKTLLEQQKFMIESTTVDGMVLNALDDGAKTLDHLHSKLDMDKLEDVKDKIDEQM